MQTSCTYCVSSTVQRGGTHTAVTQIRRDAHTGACEQHTPGLRRSDAKHTQARARPTHAVTPAQSQDEVQRRLLLYVVIRECTTVLQLLAGKNQALLCALQACAVRPQNQLSAHCRGRCCVPASHGARAVRPQHQISAHCRAGAVCQHPTGRVQSDPNTKYRRTAAAGAVYQHATRRVQ